MVQIAMQKQRKASLNVVTLRNLPSPLVRIIRQKAQERRTSINKTVVSLLEETLIGRRKKKDTPVNHDLDHLAGSWTEDEAAEFERSLAAQRIIDPELWN